MDHSLRASETMTALGRYVQNSGIKFGGISSIPTKSNSKQQRCTGRHSLLPRKPIRRRSLRSRSTRVTHDGRTILSDKDYAVFRKSLYAYQAGMCAECDRFTQLEADIECDWSFHVHHKNGRGLGGSKRDDTINSCLGLCGKCHRVSHGQQ